MFAVLMLTLIGGYIFGRTVSIPLVGALGCARAVANGDLSLEFETHGKDEIAELLTALKYMQASLAHVVGGVRRNAALR